MQKPLEDWHGKPNSLKAFVLRHWLVDRAPNFFFPTSYSFNFSNPPLTPFQDVCHKDSKRICRKAHLPSMDIVRTVYFTTFPILL